MTFVLGLTGGIACGKSTVVAYVKSLGYPIIDADVIAREVVEPQEEGLAALIAHFGPAILQPDGQLDRAALGALVFGNPQRLAEMNAILGPIIRNRLITEITRARKTDDALVVVDIPLLYEAQYETYMDQVAVVFVDEQTQLHRLMARNQFTKAEAKARIKSQGSLAEKCQRADHVIDNTGTKEATYRQIDQLLSQLHV